MVSDDVQDTNLDNLDLSNLCDSSNKQPHSRFHSHIMIVLEKRKYYTEVNVIMFAVLRSKGTRIVKGFIWLSNLSDTSRNCYLDFL